MGNLTDGENRGVKIGKATKSFDSIDSQLSKKQKAEQDEERDKAMLEDYDGLSVLDDEAYLETVSDDSSERACAL